MNKYTLTALKLFDLLGEDSLTYTILRKLFDTNLRSCVKKVSVSMESLITDFFQFSSAIDEF